MGGLLAKLAILKLASLGLSDRVNKLITIGTPWFGSPDAYKVLAYGEPGFYQEFTNVLQMFDDMKTRKLARQYPSAYQLLPSESYFNSENGKFILPSNKLNDEDFYYIDVIKNVQGFYNEENKEFEEQDVIDVFHSYMKPIQDAMQLPLPERDRTRLSYWV